MDVWNMNNLHQPPLNTYKTSTKDVDLYQLSLAIYEGIVYLKQQSVINAEAALLSRCIYRMKLKFQKDKSFKAMEKINRVLLQYLRMDLINVLTSFRNLIPERYEMDTYLPNCNLLEYILLRLQGLAKLMVRAIETSEIAAYYIENKILIGQFWKLAFITFCLVARIRTLCKNIAKYTCEFYIKLLPFRSKLKNNGFEIIPKDYVFPNDLRKWLDAEWIFTDETILKLPTTDILPISTTKYNEDSDIETIDEDDYSNASDIEIIDENNSKQDIEILNEFEQLKSGPKVDHQIKTEEIVLSTIKQSMEDVGEVIERSTRKTLVKKKLLHMDKCDVIKKDKDVSINKIQSIKALQMFIKKEDQVRTNNISNSLFKSLDKMQWNMLLKIVNNWISKSKKNNSKAKLFLDKAKEALLLSAN